ncbi:MAG TPA: MASE1 domain-containing protein [Myxococcaceae bacterium]|nr:MASE1 domain-containing protein [Myxococcaceae bacterium]
MRGILLRVVLVTAAYSAAAFLGRLLVIQPEQLASFWPAAGIGLASLLVRPRKEWPWMVLAIFLANMIVNTATATPPITGRTLVIAAAFGVANCTEPIVAATLVHYVLGTPFRLNHLKDVVGLTVVVALFSNSVTALLGAAVPALAFGAPYWPVWRVWWTADALGILLAAPIILSWATVDWLRAAFTLRQRGPEGVALLIATAVVANLVFGNKELDAGSAFLLTFPYATFPFLLWAAVRLGLRGASLTALTVAVVAVWHTVHHLGPFAATTADVSSQVLSSQAFLAVATLSALMLATVIGERERVEAALHEANVDLEQRIQLRTVELTETNQKLREEVVVREKAEEEVKRSVADLARSNGELQQFAYVASHDLREPLRAVGGVVQLLEQNYKAQMDGRAKEYVTHIVDGVTRMQLLIDDLLEFSRIGTRGNPAQEVETSEVLRAVMSNLSMAVKESGAVVTNDALPRLQCDPTQLTQLLQNLVANAIKFHGDKSPEVHVSAEQKDGEWIFCVRDNGIGIDPQYFERIFTIFQRLHTRRAYPGSGIGLAICKKIVSIHGGRIWVESAAGMGARFYFTYPRAGAREVTAPSR